MAEVLTEVITEEELQSRIDQLGAQLTRDYDGMTPVFVGVLMGSVPFLADLVRAVALESEVEFLALSRFGEGGRVRFALDTQIPLTGRHVVLVANVVDTGLTVTSLRRLIETRSPSSLETVALVDKASRRIVDVPLPYRGFEVGDEYLLGYGFDWQGRYRNLRSIWAVLDVKILEQDPDVLARQVYGNIDDRVTA